MLCSGKSISVFINLIFILGKASSEDAPIERFVRKRLMTVDISKSHQAELPDETIFGGEADYYLWDLSMPYSMSYSMSFDFTESPSEHSVESPTGRPTKHPSVYYSTRPTQSPTETPTEDSMKTPILMPTYSPTKAVYSGIPTNEPSKIGDSAPPSPSPSLAISIYPTFFNETLGNNTENTNSSVIVDETNGSINSMDPKVDGSSNTLSNIVLPLAVSGGLVAIGLGIFARRNTQGSPDYIDLSQSSSIVSIPNEEEI